MSYVVMQRTTVSPGLPWRLASGRHFATNGSGDDPTTDAAAFVALKTEEHRPVEFFVTEVPD